MKPIEPYDTKLNSNNAYWMARLSREVYQKISEENTAPDEDGILASIKKDDSKFMSVKGFDEDSAQAALIEHENYLCMAFRGTDELKDWLDNMNAFSREELFGEFHRGFWKSVDDLWADLFNHYQILRKGGRRPLFITGHSLGGAMASIAAARLAHDDLPFTSVYTFGQPRAMTRSTARLFNVDCKDRYYRFHNNNDLVTRVPARLMGYAHVGTYIYITQEGDMRQNPGEWFRFVDSVDGAFDDFMKKGIDGIKDHDMGNYLSAVDRWEWDT